MRYIVQQRKKLSAGLRRAYVRAAKGGPVLQETTAAAVLMGGQVDTLLLKIVSAGDCYGYSICKTLSERTRHMLDMKEATLYAGLRRLEADGLVRSYWGDETLGGRRKYYAISERGQAALNENISKWNKTKWVMDRILNGEGGTDNERQAN